MKPLGSTTFNTANIRTDEYLILASVMKENGMEVKEIAADIAMIDTLLSVQKMQIIIAGQMRTKTGRLRKNSSMLDMMDGVINERLVE